MAMHKPKKIKRFQPGGLVDSEGRPVRDGSGQPIMTGSFPEEDEITARGRAKNAEMFRSLFNRATGRGKEAASAKAPAAAPAAAPAVSKAPSASDGMDESDRRREAATKAPSRAVTSPAKAKPAVVTKEQLAKSGFDNLRDYMNAEKGLKRRDGAAPEAPQKEKSAAEKRSATRTADVAGKKSRAERRSDTRLRAGRASATSSDEANMMFKKGGSVSSASKRADGIAQRGKTRGKVY